jgi:CheY-like chemotaxis protein
LQVKIKILVADDNSDGREMLRDFLQAWGFEVLEASDGQEALAMAEECSPDLMLMDLQMPRMDGFAVIQQLRQDSRFRRLPIVAITAFAMQGDEQRALAAGFNAYVTKPVDFRSLRIQLQHLLAIDTKQTEAVNGPIIYDGVNEVH